MLNWLKIGIKLRRFFDYILECFKVPSVFAGLFLTYLKFTNFLIESYQVNYFPLLQKSITGFFGFINMFYEVLLINPLNYLLSCFSIALSILDIHIMLQIPLWYATVAFFSTILYSSQTASMKLYSPIAPYSMSDLEIQEWQSIEQKAPYLSNFILNVIHKLILMIHIPVKYFSERILAIIPQENLHGKKIAKIFKIIFGSFFLLGFFFLIYDMLIMIFYRKVHFHKLTEHSNFLYSLLLALCLAIVFAIVTVFVVPEIF